MRRKKHPVYVWVGISLSWGTVTIGGVVVNGEASNKIQVLQLSYKEVAWIQLNGYNESIMNPVYRARDT